nr:hypothetical protein [Pleurocapsa sp. MO_192.B19]
MNVLIIAGMQRSGTALTANLLGNRDFSIPQKVTNTYQSDLQQFHREVFRSQGINENGWTTKDEIELKEQHVAKAKAIIAKCDHV